MKNESIQTLGFIVVWDDKMGVNCPMGWDNECTRAICCMSDSVAIFSDRKSARKAIDISTKYALLCRAQGKPVNEDFLGECRKNLRVVPCKSSSQMEVKK